MQRQTWILAGLALVAAALLRPVASEVNQVKELAPGVYFHEGDLAGKGHCNNGWVVFNDYVLVIDANFPSGAAEILPKIEAATKKPVRFAFDTHHHGDHAYGNQFWVDHGTTPVANTGVLEEMRKYETGFFGNKPGRWEESAKTRPDVAASKLHPPTILFPKELYFTDLGHQVELRYLGVAHTHGDGWAWLPKEKILFTGDACVNGPYNYVGDGSVEEWIGTLEAAQKLGAKTVCPGHGPVADGSLLEDQRLYFVELRKQVRPLRHRLPEEVRGQVDRIKAEILKQDRIKRYVGDFFAAQVEKVYVEMGGMPFPPKTAFRQDRSEHALAHGLPLLRTPAAERRVSR